MSSAWIDRIRTTQKQDSQPTSMGFLTRLMELDTSALASIIKDCVDTIATSPDHVSILESTNTIPASFSSESFLASPIPPLTNQPMDSSHGSLNVSTRPWMKTRHCMFLFAGHIVNATPKSPSCFCPNFGTPQPTIV